MGTDKTDATECVIVTGDIFTGLHLTGPFSDRIDADIYGEDFLGSNYKIITLSPPQDRTGVGLDLTDDSVREDQAVLDSYFQDQPIEVLTDTETPSGL